MTPKEFRKFLDRDKACVHCGLDDETLVPQHRIGRGMGGSKRLNTPSNIIVFCSRFNGLIESDAGAAKTALVNGWKLQSWDNPAEVPIFDNNFQKWFILDENYGRTDVSHYWE